MINFLNNSAKYTNAGGSISLRAFEEPCEGNRACVCFVISDTGIGIKKEYLPKLFKPFTREESGDKNASESLGLGLSIAYNLITSMDGDVSVESEVGAGTTFRIHLMLARYTQGGNGTKEEYAISAPVDYELGGCNVLIAEDNALNRMILESLLTNEGITFTEACDGDQAVKVFEQMPESTFDCILMDMRMPKLDGIRATSMIRAMDRADAKKVPIIGVSANGFADDIDKARLAGINEYVTKPIDREILLAAMVKLIKHKRQN
ncbi:MAG: response regulator [Eubacteriales bacterium]|nr:response regulator [Eubacteriales bacterium]